MKTKNLAIIGLSLFSLSACRTPGEAYGQNYYTPEFFLARADIESSSISSTAVDHEMKDFGASIRDEIFKVDDFETLDHAKTMQKESFTYLYNGAKGFSGNSYVKMKIDIAGTLQIEYKEIMYQAKSWYYKIEAERAVHLFSFVNEKLQNAKAESEKIQEEAKESGKIENFLAAAEKYTAVSCYVKKDGKAYFFYDSEKQLFKTLKETEYKLVNYTDAPEDGKNVVVFNRTTNEKLPWKFVLQEKGRSVYLNYAATDSYGRKFVANFKYTVSKEAYNKILNVAVEAANAYLETHSSK